MGKNPTDQWHERVLKARAQFLEGLLNPKRKFKVTRKDVLRGQRRLLEQVKRLGKRRF